MVTDVSECSGMVFLKQILSEDFSDMELYLNWDGITASFKP